MKVNFFMKLGIVLFLIGISFGPLLARDLNFSTPADAESLDPAAAGTMEALIGIEPFYETLVSLKGMTTDLAPSLATSWEVSKDGMAITFNLRKGVKFHDGTELTAEDVRYTYERLLKTSLNSAAKTLGTCTNPQKIFAVDKYTFKMELSRVNPLVFGVLTSPFCSIVNKAYVAKYSTEGDPYGLNWMRNHPMGTGPWKFEKWLVNQRLSMTKNEDYWGGKAHFDRMNINVISDPAAAQMMLEKGELDIATRLRMDQYTTLEKSKDVDVKSFSTLKTVTLRINCGGKPFDDVRVRQALNYAINYNEIIKVVEQGKAIRNYSALPNNLWGKNHDVKPKYEFDPEKAKSLLKEAGLEKGFEARLYYSPARYAPFEDMVPLLESYFRKIGIQIKPQKLAYTTQQAKMYNRDYDLALDTWIPYFPDPREVIHKHYHSEAWKTKVWSWSFWENPTADKLITEAENTMDHHEREWRYQRVDQIGVENAVYAHLYQTQETMAMRKNIKNVVWHPTLQFKGFASISAE